jgi:hypothetical protein
MAKAKQITFQVEDRSCSCHAPLAKAAAKPVRKLGVRE